MPDIEKLLSEYRGVEDFDEHDRQYYEIKKVIQRSGLTKSMKDYYLVKLEVYRMTFPK